jgi:hypothetical protein
MVREKVNLDLMRRLEANDPQALAQARFIVKEVKRANAKQLVKHSVYMAIALLGLTALICGMVLAVGPLVPLLCGIGALLWIIVDANGIHKKLGELICGKSGIPAPAKPKAALDCQK